MIDNDTPFEDQNSSPETIPSQPDVLVGENDVPVQKITDRALKRMKGLLNGNGVDPSHIKIVETNLQIYRFKARTNIKVVSEYGVRTETGKNTRAELMTSEVEMNKTLKNIPTEICTNPAKRKVILDMILKKEFKGFGIKDQRLGFSTLNRDLVQHDRCISCKNLGKVTCVKCHGQGKMKCLTCQGRRQTTCPRCRGTARITTPNGSQACTFCKGDGRVNCQKCAGRGQVKCTSCGASGSTSCNKCAGTGWLSNVAHAQIYASVGFVFDRAALPSELASLVEKNPDNLVRKNDIEIAVVSSPEKVMNTTLADKEAVPEATDTLSIDFDAKYPHGTMVFDVNGDQIPVVIQGFQGRFTDATPFIDKYTQLGQQALLEASRSHQDVADKIKIAAQYTFLKDIILQTARVKNLKKIRAAIFTKYSAGIDRQNADKLIKAADLLLRSETRISRYLGLGCGTLLYTLLAVFYYFGGLRDSIASQGLSDFLLLILDLLLMGAGIGLGTLGGQLSALFSEKNLLKNLGQITSTGFHLPKAGNLPLWALCLSFGLTMLVLLAGIVMGLNVPHWLGPIALLF